MDKLRCKNATMGKCPDEECPHFDKHEKRFDCHLDCNRFIEDDTSCEAVNPEPIEPKISPYALPSQACDEYFTPPEPQQPEGELAECPAKVCSFKVVLPDGTRFICTAKECIAYEYAQAQLAHMIQQGWVKLPSEDELALWLCDHLSYTSRGLAQVLRERLEEKP